MIDLRIMLGLVLMSFVFGAWTGISVTENDVTTMRLAAERQTADALKLQATLHNKQVDDLTRINDEAIKKLNELNAVSGITANAADSLQHHYSTSLCKTDNTIKTASIDTNGASNATTELVHSYVFGIVNQRAAAYAKIADEARYRGLTCEAEYSAVTAVGF